MVGWRKSTDSTMDHDMLVGALLDWAIQRIQHSPTPTTSVRTSWYRTEAEGKGRFNTDGLARSIEVFYKGQVFLLYSLQHIPRKLQGYLTRYHTICRLCH